MPGSGKSTVGVILAKQSSRDFIDTDVLIQTATGRPLQEIVDDDGYLTLRAIEEETLLGIHLTNHVIATGGSAVYSEAAMAHLEAHGTVVFLDTDLPTIRTRIKDFDTRGLAKSADQGLEDLYRERLPLYQKHADLTIACARFSQEEVSARIVAELAAHPSLNAKRPRAMSARQSSL
jgi:shikimate kinase